ncbi:glycoside hydrolase family 43 protein [Photobacterium rosenbergii]|uniref:Glycoside hydrolase family 43 protein n=1 Tax=Photobacterium rosenbergii TaxID=294936 RepID=A0ABU3ZIH9_9GAMM|nr:glycoside hydrolase family 43 protein [Photobacterium rosenbergii]MDV5169935.1 glycoside hydrolase family 43 protein [Photobacterium rosenbergii]
MTDYINPLISQRADPHIYKHTDGYYYFTASVPEYDRIEIRRAKTVSELNSTSEIISAWHKPETGPYSDLVWAPEIHFNDGAWYVYFAAAPTREIKDGLFQHRMYAISNKNSNPITDEWQFEGQIDTGMDTFCLDATTFSHNGKLYYVWAQKAEDIRGNSNLYIAEMKNPTELATAPVLLSVPEYDWEQVGFWVNEGPSILHRNGKFWMTYSASATDENYCMGLLYADENSNLLDPASWHKSEQPVFSTNWDKAVYGPGHNSFTVDEQGNDLLVYHARNYTEIEGDPLWDPNRHTHIKRLQWVDGFPVFGEAI